MAIDSDEKKLFRNQHEIPSYFRMDRTGRDGFLSQIGAINEEFRNLFNLLCDMMEPVLSYKKIVKKMKTQYPAIVDTLHTLMTYLEDGRCGLIAQTIQDGQLVNDRIILTNRDAPQFWYWFIEQAWQTVLISDKKPYPAVEDFQKFDNFPLDILNRIALTDISRDFISHHTDEVKLYAMQYTKKNRILVTPATLPTMVEVSRLKILRILNTGPRLQTEIARLSGMSETILLQSLASNNDKSWYTLSKKLTQNRERLIAIKINFTLELFCASTILEAFYQNEIVMAEEKQKEEEEKSKAMKNILVSIAKKTDFLVTGNELHKMFDPYEDRWPDMETEFRELYMSASDRKNLPIVLLVGNSYLYRDYLYLLFKTQHNVASDDLKKYYINKFAKFLKSGNNNRITIFSSTNAFQNDIREKIAVDYPVLKSLLATPRMVADGIVHYGSKVLKKNDMKRLKIVLERYFVVGTVRFKGIDELFDLYLSQIFEKAFMHLSPLRRLFMRLSGRYESYVRVYNPLIRNEEVPHTPPQGKNPSREKISKKQAKRGESAGDGGRRKPVDARSSTSQQQTRNKTAGQSRGNRNSKKLYSAKQQDNAWREFHDIYNKHEKK